MNMSIPGFTVARTNLSESDDDTDPAIRIGGGVSLGFPFTDNAGFRTGIFYARKGMLLGDELPVSGGTYFDYIEVPALLRIGIPVDRRGSPVFPVGSRHRDQRRLLDRGRHGGDVNLPVLRRHRRSHPASGPGTDGRGRHRPDFAGGRLVKAGRALQSGIARGCRRRRRETSRDHGPGGDRVPNRVGWLAGNSRQGLRAALRSAFAEQRVRPSCLHPPGSLMFA